ncbi:glycerophosphodiester phosphodiesterase [Acidothermaceae bacterium B102]|nr:glycerophosphodiester phosphodiesterase [Acidothermaceae bacterium B102]
MPAPRVIAHRGASDEAPEHTLAAYRRAIEAGADGLECDVRMTRDGVLVCVHDRRVDRTSDGRGAVSALALADLEQLDFSVRRRRVLARTAAWQVEGRTPSFDTVGVLTLGRLLALVAEAPRRVELAIETKYPTRYAGRLEEELVRQLDRSGLPVGEDSPVRVMSFASASLRRVHALAPSLPTVLLLRRLSPRLREGELPTPITIAGPYLGLVRRNPWFVERAHEAGHEVHVWTVDDEADVDLMASLGVDAIITNRPQQVLARLGR